MKKIDPDTGKLILSLHDYLDLEEEEILGDDNMYYAGLALGHSPSREEAAEYYVEHGGASEFEKKYILEGRVRKSQEKKDEKN